MTAAASRGDRRQRRRGDHGVRALLEPIGSWLNIKTRNTTNSALLCSLVQIARVMIVHVIVGVLGVIVDVLIGLYEVLVIYVAIF